MFGNVANILLQTNYTYTYILLTAYMCISIYLMYNMF